MDLTQQSAVDLARLIRQRAVSSVDVVEAHIRRIEATHRALNAVVEQRFDRARDEAGEADRRVLGGGELPALLGVPFTVKEAIALRDAPLTSGSTYRRGIRADQDATAVARVRAAGAIPLGVTNISEMCMWMESDNVVYGRTNNPHDLERTCGGSSGGEGAVVGAGGSPFGVGADIGGSIRMPAFFCGVFGHKPTGGLVPTTGHYPEPAGEARRICTIGPLCRRAEDLMPLLRIMAGPDGRDTRVREGVTLGDPQTVDFAGTPILVCQSLGGPTSGVRRDMRQALEQAASCFAQQGAAVRPWTSPLLRRAVVIWAAALEEAGESSFHSIIGEGNPPSLWREWFELLRGRPNHTLPALGLATVEKLAERLPRSTTAALVQAGRELRGEIETTLAHGGLLLVPPHPRVAPRHNSPLRRPLDFVYTALFNALRLPATTAPLGLNKDGLPLGVQLVGPRLTDHRTIAGASLLERSFGGWRSPKL